MTMANTDEQSTSDQNIPAIVDLIRNLRRLRELATPGEWYISDLDGSWAAAVNAPLLKKLAEGLGTIGGGPERPIGDCDFSGADEAYALGAVNSVPALLDEIELLREACQSALRWVENMRIVEGGERARLRDVLRNALGPRTEPRE
jgi:hypothetical protein